jgi:L-fuculose-phosphate aldolase
MAGLVPATPIIVHSVCPKRAAPPCTIKRGRRDKPGDDGSWGWVVSRNHRVAERELRTAAAGAKEESSMTHYQAKQKLILAGRVLVAEGQDDFTRGHVSVRAPNEPWQFFMKPHSVGLDEITHDNILTIDLEGKVISGGGRRHSEVFIHSEIYKARPDVQSVVHTHPPYAVALSASGRPMRCFSQPAALFYHELGIYADTINLIRTSEMGAAVARALGPHRAALLKNHGVVVVGGTIEEAVINTIMLENAAMVQMIAEAAGDPAPDFPAEDIARLKHDISRPDQFVVNFNYLVRRLERRR